MNYLLLTDAELNILQGEPHYFLSLYVAIKRYMDWETGITGLKRRISESYLREVLEVNAKNGRTTSIASRGMIRHGIESLLKLGLLQERQSFVFFLPYAMTQKSVQKRYNQGTTKGTTKKHKNNQLNNQGILDLSTEGETKVFKRYNPPHYISKDIYNNCWKGQEMNRPAPSKTEDWQCGEIVDGVRCEKRATWLPKGEIGYCKAHQKN